MPKIAYIRHTERVVGEGHPSRDDVLNRPVKQLLEIAGWDPDANDVKPHHFPLGVYADDVYARTGATQTVHPAVHMLDNLDVDGDTHLVGDLVVDGSVTFNGWMNLLKIGSPTGATLTLGEYVDAGNHHDVDVVLAKNSSFTTDEDSIVNLHKVNFICVNTPGSPVTETLKWWYGPFTINDTPLFEHRITDAQNFFILGTGGGGIKSGAFPEGDIVKWRVESAAPNPGFKNVCEWRNEIEFYATPILAGFDLLTKGAGGGEAARVLVKRNENPGWASWVSGVNKDINSVTTLAELKDVVGNLIMAFKTHHGLLSG